jgi:hypothetical protein
LADFVAKVLEGFRNVDVQMTSQIRFPRDAVVRNAVPCAIADGIGILFRQRISGSYTDPDRLLQQNRHEAEVSGVAAIPSAIGGTSDMPRAHTDRQSLTRCRLWRVGHGAVRH